MEPSPRGVDEFSCQGTGAGGGAPSVVGVSKVQAPANNGTVVVPKPGGLAVGDFIIVYVTLHPWYGGSSRWSVGRCEGWAGFIGST